jgi:hypothetical protein
MGPDDGGLWSVDAIRLTLLGFGIASDGESFYIVNRANVARSKTFRSNGK